jgi:hypothetical protein
MMILEDIGEYRLCLPTSGGKAGKEKNATSTVQVMKREHHYVLLVKSFRFRVGDSNSYESAKARAMAFVRSSQCPEHDQGC